ncbi:agmatinase family protein [Spirulina sp. 06S082]|uniref:agmatinase family protein n=1 Tax=Spirulina sp. 06S082 TaxID=3110248 RepID=UPI002B200EB8|nr:agmatinase family protein [Spirulina sp. 06S082]MEA5467463.1 agmatinase family protein [Spirulina sp. 06S082]
MYLDPNDISPFNGNFFGLPSNIEKANLVYFPVPWDVTTSYGEGTAEGPQAILEASYEPEWYDFDFPDIWQVPRGTVPISQEIYQKNQEMRSPAKKVIQHLENGGKIDASIITQELKAVNQASIELNNWVYQHTKTFLEQNKLIALIGGDHSVPLGYMQALAEKYSSYCILQIDAHADLRNGYEGFIYSHASIMYHALQIPNINRLVQVGIRDVCQAEIARIQQDKRIIAFDDWQLKDNAFSGMTWAAQCQEIVTQLPDRVYISFDIDGLSPELCPHTGTPVPGGLQFNEAIYLLREVVKAGKTIIGCDLCEVAPGNDEWDGNIGARLLYKLSNFMLASQAT